MNRHTPVRVLHVELRAHLCSADFFCAHLTLFWKDTPNTINSKMRGVGGRFFRCYAILNSPVFFFFFFLNPGHM